MTRNFAVVGAAILRDRRTYCVQRGPTKTLPGMWEFPGGKVEPGEDPLEALAREIQEELLCRVVVGAKVTDTSHDYDFGRVHLSIYFCELIDESPTLTEHVRELWAGPTQMTELVWAPADIPAVELVIEHLTRSR